MITYIKTNSENSDFQKLILQLDQDLKTRNGEENSFFAQFNKTDSIKHVVVAYHNNIPVGCGAIKKYTNTIMEIKRMFVLPETRGKGIASGILKELENWTQKLGYNKCILETGEKQLEAIGLYKKNNYIIIPNYGQYQNVESSICFEKIIN